MRRVWDLWSEAEGVGLRLDTYLLYDLKSLQFPHFQEEKSHHSCGVAVRLERDQICKDTATSADYSNGKLARWNPGTVCY